MKSTLLLSLGVIVFATSSEFARATDTNDVGLASEVRLATAQVAEKFKAGNTTEADLAGNLRTINDLIIKHLKDEDREQLARLYLLQAHIYADALDDVPRARAVWVQVLRDFPGTSGLPSQGYEGAVSAGRYLSFAPYHNTNDFSGIVLRFDARLPRMIPATVRGGSNL